MAFDNEVTNEEQAREGLTKATAGNTITIGYDVSFADGNKKTVSIGSYASADVPDLADLRYNIAQVNASIDAGNLTDFTQNFVSSTGATTTGITGCTITNKTVTIIKEDYQP